MTDTNSRKSWGKGFVLGDRQERTYHPYTMNDFEWPDLEPKYPILKNKKLWK